MRSRHALTAALALSVVTILTVAACGSSVQGTAQVNTAAAESATSAETTVARTTSERTGRTSIAVPTEVSDLSSMLNDLPTEIPSDLPSDLGGFLNSDCLAVSGAYAKIYADIGTGAGVLDSQELQQYLDGLGGEVPAELAPDFEALQQIADEAKGKDITAIGELFSSEKFTTADGHVQAWLDTNCGG